jgi:hypothetical protein
VRRLRVIENTLEERDTSQPEAEDLVERVKKLCDEWMLGRSRVPAKLVRHDKLPNHPEPKKEE